MKEKHMSGETSHFEIVLERIVRTSLDQFKDISDSDLNRPLALPESNTAFALATHLIGSAEYWVLEVAGGHAVQRDRLAEFSATGEGTALVARYERCLVAMREALDTLADAQLEQSARVDAR